MEEMERNAFKTGRSLTGQQEGSTTLGCVGTDRSIILANVYDRNERVVGNACYLYI